ncbi:MAG TPA: CHAT domain-containing protein [Candidatus Polarisedimenticolaceae bacterium]|nr:CHAT domain-containing protein [Candidatus Polarisedimenticolaceae bacterium]
MRGWSSGAAVLLLLASSAEAGFSLDTRAVRGLPDCERLVAAHPGELDAWRCFEVIALRDHRVADAAEALERHRRQGAHAAAAALYLGRIENVTGGTRAGALLREAAEAFAASKEARGEVYARLTLAWGLLDRGKTGEADREVTLAAAPAERDGDPVLRARIRWLEARLAFVAGQDARGLRAIEEGRALLRENDPADVRLGLENLAGTLAWRSGRWDDALAAYRRALAISRTTPYPRSAAAELSDIASVLHAMAEEGAVSFAEASQATDAAIEAALQARADDLEAAARLQRAAERDRPLQDRAREAERCADVLRARGETTHRIEALSLLAEFRAGEGRPAEGDALLEEAERAARAMGSPAELARVAVARAMVRFTRDGPDGARREALAAMDVVDHVAEGLADPLQRARVRARWRPLVLGVSGALLEAGDVEGGFAIAERMRAGALREALRVSEAPERSLPPELAARRQRIHAATSRLGRTLADPDLAPDRRLAALGELERWETAAAALDDEVARTVPPPGPLLPPEAEDLRAALRPDRALLAFQLGERERDRRRSPTRGGSWVVCVTSRTLSAFPLPDAPELDRAVRLFLGLVPARDGREAETASRLFEMVAGEAVGALGPEVRRLVIVPDGILHLVPFDALRDGEGRALAERFDLTVAPSAAVWLELRTRPESHAPAPLLAVTDPSEAGPHAALRDGGFWSEGLRLGPLRGARAEAAHAARRFGAGGRLLQGEDASERRLKETDLAHYRVVHLATHAVVDERHPERSAVLLRPGAADEDGLLQPREIAELRLPGAVVVLAACGSAGGERVAGEAPYGLAHAFFQAGARAVVASLWPLRDDRAERLFGQFTEELASGKSVAGALAAARRERRGAGEAAADWAGVVVLGDGDFVPFPGGVPRPRDRHQVALAAAVMLAVSFFGWWLGRKGWRARLPS